MSVAESVATFEVAGETLVGVLSSPVAAMPRDIGVLVIVGGPQYRAGSHRQFVSLARALAAEGYPVLRFDCRGMGDSSGAQVGFEQSGIDIGAAIDELQRLCPALREVVLWGLCDGASAALLYLDQTADRRVAGLVLLNPWVRSEATLARTHVKHYYFRRLRQREFWVKLSSGGVAGEAISGFGRNVIAMLAASMGKTRQRMDAELPFQGRMARAMAMFEGPVALMLSGDDYTAHEFSEHAKAEPVWRASLARTQITSLQFEDADHTFSNGAAQQELEAATVAWLASIDVEVERGRPASGIVDRRQA